MTLLAENRRHSVGNCPLTLEQEKHECEGSNEQGAEDIHPEAESVACAQEKRPRGSVVILQTKNIIQFWCITCHQIKISATLHRNNCVSELS
jgi:hypothetical protein